MADTTDITQQPTPDTIQQPRILGSLFGSSGSSSGGDMDQQMADLKRERAWNGLLGLLAGAGAASGPSRMSVPLSQVLGQGVQTMLAAQAGTTNGALKHQDMYYKNLQGQSLQQTIKNQKAFMEWAGQEPPGGSAPTSGGVANPTDLQPARGGGSGGESGNYPTLDNIGGGANDPRNVVPVIRSTAIKYGIDPDVAVRVAQSEGLSDGYNPKISDDGTSFGAFQLHIGGDMGDDFRRDTNLDPSEPAGSWSPKRRRRGCGMAA
jgi:hypothetical protein